MEFVINEWFLDWHRSGATPEEQVRAFRFLDWLLQSQNRIVILRTSNFIRKLHQLRRDGSVSPLCQLKLKVFFGQILENPERCRIIEVPPALSPEIEALLERPVEAPFHNKESDRYLFQTAQATNEKIIVTTDRKLIEHMGNTDNFHVILADDFFAKYLSEKQ